MSRPQGQTRRWPDLLIGLLVLLLLAGFVTLLLGQRSPAPTPTATQAPAPEATSAATPPAPVVIPSAPGTDLGQTETPAPTAAPQNPAATSSAATSAQTAEPASSQPAASQPETAATPQATATTPSATSTPSASTTIPVVPAEPIPAPVTSPAAQAPVPTPSTSSAQTTPATTPAPSTASASVPPRSGGAVATSEQRTPLRSDYRISLGTFGSTGEAQSRTQGVSELGYTVYPIDLGSQVVAQVGPFADEATARQALADIQRAYPGAILYPPRNRSLTGSSRANGTAAESSPSTPTAPAAVQSESTSTTSTAPAETTTARTTPAPSGPVYLQVGAFDRVESAQNLVGQLREQGYTPTVNAPEGRKVTVLIGPFSGKALTDAEAKLDANGFDHFRVR
ncbi:SPOR domain protein [Deinococcus geothermalis DSM 11300]|uniref:SPOR domain protein n=1 Tax=Deinococcus geothermalis (strain DSM 11300 / CIP 105573 / AG-3a) TaxID=319795 RepID=Q1J0Q1_DEIGD|nr:MULTISPECIES: SPOR domain-containing protein [Deinococcus]ABF44933.1 SPOR domain protein [Deinococcus geothermalis DSM 11300]MBI0446474.1 SPOR domain-containing protein [Deinococcus sp. DB0503]TDE85688.1 SPOR domain-containing protein [Deinococcus sp. S9]